VAQVRSAGMSALPLASRCKVILLTAIARARFWMNDLTEGRVNSFEEIARSENKAERHIRHLAPLAFASPSKQQWPAQTIRASTVQWVKLTAAITILWGST
jgi:hypothetical protein